jgi:hypothetical protein
MFTAKAVNSSRAELLATWADGAVVATASRTISASGLAEQIVMMCLSAPCYTAGRRGHGRQ